MRIKNFLRGLIGSLAAFAAFTHAAIIIDISESGGDVVAVASGSFDLAQCSSTAPGSALGLFFEDGSDRDVIVGTGGADTTCASAGPVFPSPFSGNINQTPSSSTGGVVGVGVNSGSTVIFLPDGYVSGAALSSSSTWAGETFSSLNLTVGSYTVAVGAESITVNVLSNAPSATSVPVMPLWMLSLMTLMMASVGYRFKARSSK